MKCFQEWIHQPIGQSRWQPWNLLLLLTYRIHFCLSCNAAGDIINYLGILSTINKMIKYSISRQGWTHAKNLAMTLSLMPPKDSLYSAFFFFFPYHFSSWKAIQILKLKILEIMFIVNRDHPCQSSEHWFLSIRQWQW